MARVAKRARIAHDDEPSSRPRDCDAEPPRVAQEADLANIIGTRCRDDDQLGLLRTADAHGSGPIKVTEGHVGPELGAKERAHLTLKRVDGAHAARAREVRANVVHLARVRRKDRNALR